MNRKTLKALSIAYVVSALVCASWYVIVGSIAQRTNWTDLYPLAVGSTCVGLVLVATSRMTRQLHVLVVGLFSGFLGTLIVLIRMLLNPISGDGIGLPFEVYLAISSFLGGLPALFQGVAFHLVRRRMEQ